MIIINLYNLVYGDLNPEGSIDDMAISNNGDIIKFFLTIIDIVQFYTRQFPIHKIHFSGSTKQRTSYMAGINDILSGA
jgi:hypothetical protein